MQSWYDTMEQDAGDADFAPHDEGRKATHSVNDGEEGLSILDAKLAAYEGIGC